MAKINEALISNLEIKKEGYLYLAGQHEGERRDRFRELAKRTEEEIQRARNEK